jgi:hypothetical protein
MITNKYIIKNYSKLSKLEPIILSSELDSCMLCESKDNERFNILIGSHEGFTICSKCSTEDGRIFIKEVWKKECDIIDIKVSVNPEQVFCLSNGDRYNLRCKLRDISLKMFLANLQKIDNTALTFGVKRSSGKIEFGWRFLNPMCYDYLHFRTSPNQILIKAINHDLTLEKYVSLHDIFELNQHIKEIFGMVDISAHISKFSQNSMCIFRIMQLIDYLSFYDSINIVINEWINPKIKQD